MSSYVHPMKNHPTTCFECGEGKYQESLEDYRIELPNGKTVTLSEVLILQCDKCGERVIPPESSWRIDNAIHK